MYTQDMTLADCYATRKELRLLPQTEQVLWDIEDIEAQIFILTA